MKHFDHIKNKLRQEQALPDEFLWENSKEGIYAKMAAKTETTGSLPIFTKLMASLGLIVILLFVVLVIFTKDEANLDPAFGDSTNSMSHLGVSSNAKIKTKIAGSLNTPTTLKENNNSIASNTILDYSELNKSSSVSSSSIESQEKNKLTNENSKELNEQLITSQLDVSIVQPDAVTKENSIHNMDSEHLNFSAIDEVLSTNHTEKANTLNFNIQRLNKLVFDGFDFISTVPELSFHRIESFTPIRKATIRSPFSIELGFGLNYLHPNFGNSMASQERDQYESGDFGHSASLRLAYRLKNNISISSGIEWRTLYSKFDAEFVNSYEEVLEDQLLEIQMNPYSSEDVRIYGDTLVTITETRKILHHNSHKQFAIPIVFNYFNKYKSMEFGFGMGALFSLSNSTEGKTIQMGELVEYSASDIIYKRKLGASFLAEINANYTISKHLYIGGRISFNKNFEDWSATDMISLIPSIGSGQIVVGYNF